MTMEAFELAPFLRELFPDWESLTADCWIRRAIERDPYDFSEVLDAITRVKQRDQFGQRLRAEHPMPPKSHSEFHDDRVRDAFTEAEACAWAVDVAGMESVQFVFDEGSPDLRAGVTWIEAKTINPSANDEWNRQRRFLALGSTFWAVGNVEEPTEGLVGKFESAFQNALLKWSRVGSGQLVVFFCFVRADVQVVDEGARQLARRWAAEAEQRNPAKVVICYNHHWSTPIYSTF